MHQTKCILILGLWVPLGLAFQPRIGAPISSISSFSHGKPPLIVRTFPQSSNYKSRLAVAGGKSQATTPAPTNSNQKSILAASILIALDIFFRKLLQVLNISFPSSLAGCGALFATFLFAPIGSNFYYLLSPGASLLAKWLPVFFVPSLITLPLADSPGSVLEVGFVYINPANDIIVFVICRCGLKSCMFIVVESCFGDCRRLLFYPVVYCLHGSCGQKSFAGQKG